MSKRRDLRRGFFYGDWLSRATCNYWESLPSCKDVPQCGRSSAKKPSRGFGAIYLVLTFCRCRMAISLQFYLLVRKLKTLYLSFFFCLFICSLLTLIIISLFGHNYVNNYIKLIIFECGFTSMINSRSSFSLRFFLIIILFLIFDTEIILFVPIRLYKSCFSFYTLSALVSTIVIVLVAGLFYE